MCNKYPIRYCVFQVLFQIFCIILYDFTDLTSIFPACIHFAILYNDHGMKRQCSSDKRRNSIASATSVKVHKCIYNKARSYLRNQFINSGFYLLTGFTICCHNCRLNNKQAYSCGQISWIYYRNLILCIKFFCCHSDHVEWCRHLTWYGKAYDLPAFINIWPHYIHCCFYRWSWSLWCSLIFISPLIQCMNVYLRSVLQFFISFYNMKRNNIYIVSF